MHRIAMLLENNAYPADVRVRREAVSLVRAGHEVCVCAPRASGQPKREEVDGVRVRRFRLPPAGTGKGAFLGEYASAALALHAAAARELAAGATVLHLHNPPDMLFPAGWLARGLGRRVVFDHHDLFPELVEAKFGPGRLVSLARTCERATFAVADRVLAANESHAEVARIRGAKDPSEVFVVRNGPRAEHLAEPNGRPGVLHDPHLLYVGAVSDQDGVEALPRMLALLGAEHGLAEARLTIVGDGDARPLVESAARERGVADRVRFTGWLDVEDVPEMIRSADICVDPAPPTTLNEQSTMIKIAEYLAAAKPVVAYELLETARTVDGAALLAPRWEESDFAALVARLAADGAERERLAHAARRRAEALTWERSEQTLLEAYESL